MADAAELFTGGFREKGRSRLGILGGRRPDDPIPALRSFPPFCLGRVVDLPSFLVLVCRRHEDGALDTMMWRRAGTNRTQTRDTKQVMPAAGISSFSQRDDDDDDDMRNRAAAAAGRYRKPWPRLNLVWPISDRPRPGFRRNSDLGRQRTAFPLPRFVRLTTTTKGGRVICIGTGGDWRA